MSCSERAHRQSVRTPYHIGLCALGALALSTSLSACDDGVMCWDVAYEGGLEIALQRAAWTPGTYTLELAYDSYDEYQSLRCEIRIPEHVAARPDAATNGSAATVTRSAATIVCTGANFSGYELRESEGQFVVALGTPKVLSLRVTQDGAVLHDAVHRPQYHYSHPGTEPPDCPGGLTGRLDVQLP